MRAEVGGGKFPSKVLMSHYFWIDRERWGIQRPASFMLSCLPNIVDNVHVLLGEGCQ